MKGKFLEFVADNFAAGVLDRRSWGKQTDLMCALCGKICWRGSADNGDEVKCCTERTEKVLEHKIYQTNIKDFNRGQREQKYYEAVKRSGIDGKYINVSFKKFLAETADLQEAKAKAEAFVSNNFLNLLIMGNVGTGKTHLAISALKKHIWENDLDGRIIFADAEIKECDYRVSFLVLDDICRESGTEKYLEFRKSLMRQIIDTRNRNNLKTIYTTNSTKAEILNMFGGHTVDRMYEKSQTIIITGESRRAK